MTAARVFFAYVIEVASMGTNVASPSYCTVSFASKRVMLAVCGIELAISASLAWGVPGTDARTVDFGLSKGIFTKSGGSSLPDTNIHGPCSEVPRNQRPEIRM